MPKRAENEVLGHFLELGTSDGLDIVDYDQAKCFSAFVDVKRSCIINEACIISINYAKKRAENEVLGHFLEKYHRCMHETAPEYSSNDSLCCCRSR